MTTMTLIASAPPSQPPLGKPPVVGALLLLAAMSWGLSCRAAAHAECAVHIVQQLQVGILHLLKGLLERR